MKHHYLNHDSAARMNGLPIGCKIDDAGVPEVGCASFKKACDLALARMGLAPTTFNSTSRRRWYRRGKDNRDE